MSESKVKKCPACGAIIQSHTTICPECGYAIEDNKSNQSVEQFSRQVSERLEHDTDKGVALRAFIRGYSIPNNKTDLLEFTSVLNTMSNNFLCGSACDDKLRECINKINILFPNDPQFQQLKSQIEDRIAKEEEAEKKGSRRFLLGGLGIIVVCGLFGLLLHVISPETKTNPVACSKKVMTLLAKEKVNEAKRCLDEYSAGLDKDMKDAYTAVITSLLEKDNISDAKKMCDRWVSEVGHLEQIEQSVQKYLIKKGMYDEAEAYYGVFSKDYYEYLKDCVEDMCKQGKIEEAKRFVKRKIVYFSGEYEYTTFSEKNVQEKLNRIIDSY